MGEKGKGMNLALSQINSRVTLKSYGDHEKVWTLSLIQVTWKRVFLCHEPFPGTQKIGVGGGGAVLTLAVLQGHKAWVKFNTLSLLFKMNEYQFLLNNSEV